MEDRRKKEERDRKDERSHQQACDSKISVWWLHLVSCLLSSLFFLIFQISSFLSSFSSLFRERKEEMSDEKANPSSPLKTKEIFNKWTWSSLICYIFLSSISISYEMKKEKITDEKAPPMLNVLKFWITYVFFKEKRRLIQKGLLSLWSHHLGYLTVICWQTRRDLTDNRL